MAEGLEGDSPGDGADDDDLRGEARGAQVFRQWRILSMIADAPQGLDIYDLAERVEVDPRTIRRDLKVLDELFPFAKVHDEQSAKVRYTLPRDSRFRGLKLTPTELLALFFSQTIFKGLTVGPLQEGITSVLKKLEASIDPRQIQHFASLDSALAHKPEVQKDYRNFSQTFREITRAMHERVKVEIEYQAYGYDQPAKYLFHPYGTLSFAGSIYVIGHSEHSKAVRVLLLDRIRSAVATENVFHKPPDFDLGETMAQSFGVFLEKEPTEFLIEFDKGEARFIEERHWPEVWQPEIKRMKDGRLRLRMTVMGVPEVVRWVMAYGASARILEPLDVAADVARRHREAARQYGKS